MRGWLSIVIPSWWSRIVLSDGGCECASVGCGDDDVGCRLCMILHTHAQFGVSRAQRLVLCYADEAPPLWMCSRASHDIPAPFTPQRRHRLPLPCTPHA